ncbi:L-serine ammonia-lyase, iron-sulfur-dependent, subunit alpha [Candidatus Cryosericum hinesii]|jgi:L-serine dehydratase|uniref:L-serine dehydratase n=1 Tax=Candidatus Cryosericum hinesii TaxID=2290915 RepID=A0A398DCS3_9BACT|nr:L-serine ammonia-lyase, iron-sulfur-dependent, subunit alpha [Candidatus Cryosericum hinesii]RIE08600.1 L-serine ammonia-lyase, iron-sulfur-dependent, subunit alpha [Candidatus Cryosericum hinesii]RIE12293.1 L-serine ammonia-lyase, iron-sulfur-dependent, subunit alpha [Candidatus Cryosericum hinesii]RIE12427.1 L-serine ammonia-lyase, iron-sulfur-dependent, subunit alpha [Candidatus Cryosericum hinesii]
MSVPKKTEVLDEIKRIRIHGLSDARRLMEEYDILTLAGFFVMYESKNQELPESEVISRMHTVLDAMHGTLREGLEHPNRTPSRMIDGGAAHMDALIRGGGSLLGNQFSTVIRNTLAAAENNACMGRIVAAPTAGASGVLPGAYLTIADAHHVAEERIVQGLFVAGGIGECIALQASLSGSQHGCQAENGSAGAMTAAALVSLFSEDQEAIESAAAFALKSVLGLVCDPIAGLVEIPCVKRNVMAAVNAVASAEMALAGIRTVVPFDEVVQAMDHIGRDMSSSLKETSLGGLAATPTAVRIAAEFKRIRP